MASPGKLSSSTRTELQWLSLGLQNERLPSSPEPHPRSLCRKRKHLRYFTDISATETLKNLTCFITLSLSGIADLGWRWRIVGTLFIKKMFWFRAPISRSTGHRKDQILQRLFVTLVITTRIRRMGEGYIFTLCVSPHPPAGTAVQVRASRRAVCLLRSRRRTFLLQLKVYDCKIKNFLKLTCLYF